jgi:hypothetical protein
VKEKVGLIFEDNSLAYQFNKRGIFAVPSKEFKME